MTTNTAADPHRTFPGDDTQLVEALRRGDEAAFAEMLDCYHGSMLQLALLCVADRAVAEEVVRETWAVILSRLDRYDGHSPLKVWAFRILLDCAQARAQRAGRSFPSAARWGADAGRAEPAIAPARFLPADHPRWPRHWARAPLRWDAAAEDGSAAEGLQQHLRATIAALPPGPRVTVVLHDAAGWTPGEVSSLLGIGEADQRALLHHARSRLRCALEEYFTRLSGSGADC